MDKTDKTEEEDAPKEFPDVSTKLSAPKKLSAFERERLAAEEKKKRAEAEDAAALRDLIEDLVPAEDEDKDEAFDGFPSSARAPYGGSRGGRRGGYGYGHSRGGFGGPPRGGPGSLGPSAFGAPPPPPPPSLKRKRALDELREEQEIRREQEALEASYHRPAAAGRDSRIGDPLRHGETEPRPPVTTPRPCLRLWNLPNARRQDVYRTVMKTTILKEISPEQVVIKLLSPWVTVTEVWAQGCRYGVPKESIDAVAALEHDTPKTKVEAAVRGLHRKFLGSEWRVFLEEYGHHTVLKVFPSTKAPDHIRRIMDELGRYGLMWSRGMSRLAYDKAGFEAFVNLAVQQGQRVRPVREFRLELQQMQPPPELQQHIREYEQTLRPRNFHTVPPPLDFESKPKLVHLPPALSTTAAMHSFAEDLLSRGPAGKHPVEDLFVNDDKVEQDQRFTWLFELDDEAPEGIYYHWLLCPGEDRCDALRKQKGYAPIDTRIWEDRLAYFVPGKNHVPPLIETTRLYDVLDNPSHKSSDEESGDGEEQRKFNIGRRDGGGDPPPEKQHLGPLKRAKFSFLLSHMPTSQARLRKRDVGMVTYFAISHASIGAEDIVRLLILNVEKPFSQASCAKFDDEDSAQDDQNWCKPEEDLWSVGPLKLDGSRKEPDADLSQVKLVGLYLINDVLHNSATAGVRNAWKYRQLFETAFTRQKTFRNLGGLGKQLGWGKMKEEQWRNKIRVLFDIWETNSVFASEVFAALKEDFFEQPVQDNNAQNAGEEEDNPNAGLGVKSLAGFRRIDGAPSPAASASPAPPTTTVDVMPADISGASADDLDGLPMEDLDGAPIDDMDGAPMTDLDGASMDDLDDAPMADVKEPTTSATVPMVIDEPAEKTNGTGSLPNNSAAMKPAPEPASKKQTDDMFADSDDE